MCVYIYIYIYTCIDNYSNSNSRGSARVGEERKVAPPLPEVPQRRGPRVLSSLLLLLLLLVLLLLSCLVLLLLCLSWRFDVVTEMEGEQTYGNGERPLPNVYRCLLIEHW